MTSRVLIDASNLRRGGGVQVAASFLDELARLVATADALERYPWLATTTVEATHRVLQNVRPETVEALGVRHRETSPRNFSTWMRSDRYDLSFTVFGPAYGPRRGRRTVVGFADVTSLYDRPPQLPPQGAREALTALLRRNISRMTFRSADHLVVEAEHVRAALVERWHLDSSIIDVVPNCVNQRVLSSSAGPARGRGWCYITRNYEHKNINFLGRVGEALSRLGDEDTYFVLTLTADEWESLDESTKRCSRNIGPVNVSEVASVYAGCEGSIFPSLLECFSVTPLEAVALGKPVIASDRPFVRDVCGDAALYADPDEPTDWAAAILQVRTDESLRARLDKARRALQLPTAQDRARRYLEIIDDQLRR